MVATGDHPKGPPHRRIPWLPRRRPRNPLLGRGHLWHRVFVTILIAMACALPALAFLLGHHAFTASEQDRHARIASTHPIQATLQQNVYGSGGAFGRDGGGLVLARVSWTAPDGAVRVDSVPVRPPGNAGDPTTIWLDRAGNPAAEPPPRAQSILDGLSLGVAVVMVGGGVLLAGYAGERSLFMRARMRAWAREWAEVAPKWSART
jgi:hypothetical protein